MGVMPKLLVIAKRSAYDMYAVHHGDSHLKSLLDSSHSSVKNLMNRHSRHNETISYCLGLFKRLGFDTTFKMRDDIRQRIVGFDYVTAIGGDGTVLESSHYLDDTIPILGINSDPTNKDEVEDNLSEFDATRSKGFLCGANSSNIEEVMEAILSHQKNPVHLTRICTNINGKTALLPALNDALIAHPSPACVSRFGLRFKTFIHVSYQRAAAIQSHVNLLLSLFPLQISGGSVVSSGGTGNGKCETVHVRSSGIRLCTATGSTAAMKSGGGLPMEMESKCLQFKVREPLEPHEICKPVLHRFLAPDECLRVVWGCRRGVVYLDGSHLCHEVKLGDEIDFSNRAPNLLLFHK